MNNTLEIKECGNRISIRFPFELKDSFRATFSGAKWDPAAKEWSVSSKCRARLDAWAAEAAAAVLALEARDMSEMTKDELERLRESMAMVKADAEQKTMATAELLSMRHEVVEMKLMLEEVKRHRANVISRLDEETKALKDAEEEMHREAGDIIDIRAVVSAISAMQRIAGMKRTASNRGEFEKLQAKLKTEREKLTRCGLKSNELNGAIGANYNRLDRDEKDLLTSLRFQRAENAPS